MMAEFPQGSSRQKLIRKCLLVSHWGVREQSLERGYYVT